MAKDDIFRIIYVILKELYEHKKDGTKTPKEDIGPERFGITAGYWLSIIDELCDNGYIKGVSVKETKTGKLLLGIEDADITLLGVEFLQENNMMKKVFHTLKDIKDIAPGL